MHSGSSSGTESLSQKTLWIAQVAPSPSLLWQARGPRAPHKTFGRSSACAAPLSHGEHVPVPLRPAFLIDCVQNGQDFNAALMSALACPCPRPLDAHHHHPLRPRRRQHCQNALQFTREEHPLPLVRRRMMIHIVQPLIPGDAMLHTHIWHVSTGHRTMQLIKNSVGCFRNWSKTKTLKSRI